MFTLDKNTYSAFCEENRHLYDASKYPTHPPNQTNFEKWVNNHREGLPRETAIGFRQKTTHISLETFFKKCKNMAQEIRNFIIRKREEGEAYDMVCFQVHSSTRKSNFWVSTCIFPDLKDYVTHMIVGAEFEQLKDIDVINNKKILFIVPDDASYSGKQISLFSLGGIKLFLKTHRKRTDVDIKMDVMIAIPYLSEMAIETIENNIEGFSTEYIDVKICIPSVTEKFSVFKVNPKMRKYFEFPTRDNHTFYFDHKLPDTTSIYQEVYAIGQGFGEKGVDYVYEPMNLVKGCENLPDEFLEENARKAGDYYYEGDIAKYVTRMCPYPFYKMDNFYQYKGKFILSIEDINENRENTKKDNKESDEEYEEENRKRQKFKFGKNRL